MTNSNPLTSSTRRALDYASFKSLLNSRVRILPDMIGKPVDNLLIVGNGTLDTIADQQKRDAAAGKQPAKQYFDKLIYNVRANSVEAMARPENRKLLAEAIKAESLGNVNEASDLFWAYINAVTVSFSIIADRGTRFSDGDMVKAIVDVADTKAGHKALVVNNVRKVEAVKATKGDFDLAELLGDEIKDPSINAFADQKAKS